ncbi:uncharacterized protein [Procambarus clarkii]|uniref:uncharacterized protein n=1 Tax=Procambarus clarkii TaxID=6728 RepID=UPI003743ECE1
MDKRLSVDELLSELRCVYRDHYNRNMPKTLSSAIKKMIVLAKKSEEAALQLERFAKVKKEERKVQIVSAVVPAGILPDGYSAVLEDIKIHSRGPDDKIYSKNPDIRKWIPRGTTIMHLNGNVSLHDVVIYANKKFIGGVGDEDEYQPEDSDTWREYCLGNPDNARNVVCMNKLNGEAAHFSGRYIDDEFYLFTGSKNVHMLIKEAKDIDQYYGDRYGVAKIVARSVCETLDALEDKKRHLLFTLLHYTKCTVFCEVLQPLHQHIVNISHLDQPQISVISFTSTATTGTETSLTAIPPHLALDLSVSLGLSSTTYSVISPQEVFERRNMIRGSINNEGEVFYFLNENDETIGLAKVKSTWYILLRALREKAVYCFTAAMKKGGWTLEQHINSTNKRFLEIQGWLKLSDECLQKWEKLAQRFLRWLDAEIRLNHVQSSNIRPKFPILWEQFLENNELTDKIETGYC